MPVRSDSKESKQEVSLVWSSVELGLGPGSTQGLFLCIGKVYRDRQRAWIHGARGQSDGQAKADEAENEHGEQSLRHGSFYLPGRRETDSYIHGTREAIALANSFASFAFYLF
jgi:hypothetical protein